MTNTKIFLSIFFLCAFGAFPLFAEEPRSALDSKPSVDSTALPISQRVVQAPAEIEEDAAPSSYVYDLKKLIIKSRENIKRVNDKIKEQAIIKRNQKREERAREYYQRGLQLNDAGKFDEAREYFEKAIRITEHPEMTNYIRQSQVRMKAQEAALKREQVQQIREQEVQERSHQQEASEVYQEAVRLYREKKFKEAKIQFERVQELSADYKATTSYLQMIDQDIIAAEALAQKQQKIEMGRQEKEAEEARQREKEQWKKEVERKEKERQAQVNLQAQNVYEEAVSLYKQKKFTDAKKKFQEVEWVLPDYKATRNYLNRMDTDIAQEEKRIEEEKSKALAKQQWEEEVAKRKQEAEEKKMAEEKEKARVKQLEEQASFVYQAAIKLFNEKMYDAALEKFNDVESTLPNYKSTRVYIAKIAQIKDGEKRRLEDEAKAKVLAEEKAKKQKEEEEAKEKNRQERIEAENNRRKMLEEEKLKKQKEIEEQKERIRKQKEEALKQKMESKKADEQESKATAVKKEKVPAVDQVPVKMVPVKVAPVKAAPIKAEPVKLLSREEQIKEAQEIEELARKSSMLYGQIASLSDDKRMAPAKKKMAQVDRVLNSLKSQKEEILRQIRAEEERARLEKIQREREEARNKINQMYDDAIMALRNKQFDEAKLAFADIEATIPNFKSTRQYLARIEGDRQKAEREAVLERTNAEEKRLRELEAKHKAEELAQKAAEEERRRKLKAAQEQEISVLADKAAIINDDILRLSQEKNFIEANARFADLEKVLGDLQKVRTAMEEQEEKDRAISREVPKEASKEAPKEISKEMPKVKPVEVNRPVAKKQDVEKAVEVKKVVKDPKTKSINRQKEQDEAVERAAKALSQKEIIRQREEVYRRGVDLFNRKKYSAALMIFDDLAASGDARAKAYSIKTSKIVARNAKRNEEMNEKRRTDFLAQKIAQQHKDDLAQRQVRMRQLELSKAMDREKILAEEQRQRERMKAETLRLQQKERERLEEEQRRVEYKQKEQDKIYEFRKLPMNDASGKDKDKPKDQVKAESKVVPEVKDAPIKIEEPKAIEDKKVMVDISNQRKKFLEEKYLKEQKEKELSELKLKKEREEKDRNNQLEIERQNQQRQKQLDLEKADLQKKLNEGVEAMYNDAMRMYKAKDYANAAAKFKDVEDIMPDYKKTRSLMEKAQIKVPHSAAVSHSAVPVVEAQVPVSSAQPVVPAVNRDSDIQKTLDIFDPNDR